MNYSRLLIAVLAWTFSLSALAQSWTYETKLTANDRRKQDYLGRVNRIDGDFIITGVPKQSYDASNKNYLTEAGAAYIFEFNSRGDWTQVAKLVSPERTYYREFGSSVDISGDFAIVGEQNNSTDENQANILGSSGAIFIYKRSSSNLWNKYQKIVASDRAAYQAFGSQLAFDGKTLIVSAKQKVYVFEKGGDGKWSETGKFDLPNYQTARDFSVSVSNNYAVIGLAENALDENGLNEKDDAGQAIIYEKKNGAWQQVQTVVASDRFFDANFGISTSIDNNLLVVGAHRMSEPISTGNPTNTSGAAYIFERQTNGTWTEVKKLMASDKNNNDGFGTSLSLEGAVIVIATPHQQYDDKGENFLHGAGAVYMYENQGNNNWVETKKIIYKDRDDSHSFLKGINLSGNRFIGGMDHSNDDINNVAWSGSIHVYQLGNTDGIFDLSYNHVNSFPNPALNNITVEITKSANAIEILNSNGQIVYSQSIEKQHGKISLDISRLAKGMYIIKINNIHTIGSTTFVKK